MITACADSEKHSLESKFKVYVRSVFFNIVDLCINLLRDSKRWTTFLVQMRALSGFETLGMDHGTG
jgi:hypothetical protein